MNLMAVSPESRSTNQSPVFVPTAQVNPANAILKFEKASEKTTRYTENSTIYRLKGGFEAEVIKQPSRRIKDQPILNRIYQELRIVTLRAFNKDISEAETYVPRYVMEKNVLDVDWLIVVRKYNQPVAFGAGTYVTPFIFYLNGAMVHPDYQSTGVGLIANSLLWKIVCDEVKDMGLGEADFVCRTHNRNVASVMLHVFEEGYISTEKECSSDHCRIFNKTANKIGGHYCPQSGIAKNAYPEGLPCGTKITNMRINNAFVGLGEKDGLFVAGKMKYHYLQNILKKNVKEIHEYQELKGLEYKLCA